MEFRLLGPVEAWADDRSVDVGHARQRCVLTIMLLEAGHLVPTGLLIDRVWGHDPPNGALNVLYGYVTRLRKALGPYGCPPAKGRGGYQLDIDPDTVDVHRFRRLLAEADTASAAQARTARDEALALWRGTPFGNATSPWLLAVRETLADQRLSAMLRRNEDHLAAAPAGGSRRTDARPRSRAPGGRTSGSPTHAGAVPVRATGRRARGVPARPATHGRADRRRTECVPADVAPANPSRGCHPVRSVVSGCGRLASPRPSAARRARIHWSSGRASPTRRVGLRRRIPAVPW